MEKKNARDLLRKYHENTCSEEEKALLEAWYRQWDGANTVPGDEELKSVREETWRYLAAAQKKTRQFRYWHLAASLIFLATSAILLWHLTNNEDKKQIALQDSVAVFENDAAPGGNKAILSLGDGTVITLDERENGKIAEVDGVAVRKTADGQVVYDAASTGGGQATKSLHYNLISTPRGGQYNVTLPDGTKVWLNAASSLRYPVRFTGQTRRVELSGEAYFEVTKQELGDARVPFVVSTTTQTVKVLGTRFNINSYQDEAVIKTTLIEGAVRVSSSATDSGESEGVTLKPNQQSVLSGERLEVRKVNTEDVVAWKNGYFSFEQADIRTVMRQLSRWYDLDVVYEGEIPAGTYSGKVYRDMNFAGVVEILSFSQVNFRIEGKTITIFP